MVSRSTETLVHKVADFVGLTVSSTELGYELKDRRGTITEPLRVADVFQIAADAAAEGRPVIF